MHIEFNFNCHLLKSIHLDVWIKRFTKAQKGRVMRLGFEQTRTRDERTESTNFSSHLRNPGRVNISISAGACVCIGSLFRPPPLPGLYQRWDCQGESSWYSFSRSFVGPVARNVANDRIPTRTFRVRIGRRIKREKRHIRRNIFNESHPIRENRFLFTRGILFCNYTRIVLQKTPRQSSIDTF